MTRYLTKSDEAGRWQFAALAAGQWTFYATHKAHAPGEVDGVSVGVEAVERLSIEMSDGITLRGRVVDGSGAGVVGASVEAAWGRLDASDRSAESGSAGAFELRALPDVEVSVYAKKGSLSSEPQLVDLSKGAPDIITVLEDSAISGVVLTEKNVPASKAFISLQLKSARGWNANWMFRSTRCDAEGRFHIEGLPAGAWELRASIEDGGASAHLEARTGQRDLKLVLPSSARIKGRVVDTEGRPVAQFSVSAGGAARQIFDREGRFELTASETGRVMFRVSSAGKKPLMKEMDVIAGEVTDASTLTLEDGRAVSGRVVRADGAPVEAAVVLVGHSSPAVEMEDFSVGAGHLWRAFSQKDGSFKIEGVGEGGLPIVARHPELGWSQRLQLETQSSDETITLELQATGTLRVQLRLRGRPNREPYLLGVRDRFGNQRGSPVRCDRSGRCLVERLQPGGYRVTPIGDVSFPRSEMIEVQAGETTDVEIDLGPRGQRVIFESAAPESYLVSVLYGELEATVYREISRPMALNVILGASYDRRVTCESLAAGRYTVCVYAMNPREPWNIPQDTPVRCTPLDVPEGDGEIVVEVRGP